MKSEPIRTLAVMFSAFCDRCSSSLGFIGEGAHSPALATGAKNNRLDMSIKSEGEFAPASLICFRRNFISCQSTLQLRLTVLGNRRKACIMLINIRVSDGMQSAMVENPRPFMRILVAILVFLALCFLLLELLLQSFVLDVLLTLLKLRSIVGTAQMHGPHCLFVRVLRSTIAV